MIVSVRRQADDRDGQVLMMKAVFELPPQPGQYLVLNLDGMQDPVSFLVTKAWWEVTGSSQPVGAYCILVKSTSNFLRDARSLKTSR